MSKQIAMKSIPILLFCGFVMVFAGCSNKHADVKPLALMVMKQVKTLFDTAQSYYICLPPSYDTSKSYPVVFAFDPHANGDIPVRRMMMAAAKYGFIIAGSNNSYNSAPNIEYVINSFIYDVGRQFSIEGNRVYVAGFSGGARIASTMAFMSRKIRGVVACGAGLYFPESALSGSQVKYYGMAGKDDFNYSELFNTGTMLSRTGITHYIEFFNGGHDWPSDSLMDEALLWMHINEMKDGTVPVNKELLEEVAAGFLKRIKTLNRNGHKYEAYVTSQKAISFIGGMVNIKKIRSYYNRLKKDKDVISRQQEIIVLINKEQQLRSGYQAALANQSLAWWKNEMKQLDERISSTITDERAMYMRLKNFLGMLGFMHAKNMLVKGSFTQQRSAVAIYETLSPSNPDVQLLSAQSFMLNGMTDSAIASLKAALQLGFKNIREIEQDTLLGKLYQSLSIK